jgi:hypothetical protein
LIEQLGRDVFCHIHSQIRKGKDNKMTTYRWQDFLSEKPCGSGWTAFAEAVEKHGLEAAVKEASESDRRWGAQHTYRVDILLILAQDADDDVRYYVASNPHTPVEALSALAHDADTNVRCCVARNTQASAETLNALAQDADVYVRYYVASNPHTPVETLSALAHDAVVSVRRCVAKNTHTPVETLATLATDEDANVRSIAQDRLQSIEPSPDH